MAPKRELIRLFRCVATADWIEAKKVASAIATSEAERGHHVLASQLRSSLETQRPSAVQGDIFSKGSANGSLPASTALSALNAPVPLADVAMPKRARDEFVNLVREHRYQDSLIADGIRPRRRLLIHGPPGCGKSMTARALATELNLPVYVVRLDAIVGAYLGQTASRLRELFGFAETVSCVLLIDEIDALGRSRGNARDIGELDRVAISLMQELEHSEPKGLLIATSNIASALDQALLRRFDMTVEFKRPSREELSRFASHEAQKRNLSLRPATRRQIRQSQSYANALRIVSDTHREILLQRLPS